MVIDARGFAAKIRAGFNCVSRQSQLERMLKPAISKDSSSKEYGFVTMILFPTLLQVTSVYLL